MRLNEILKIFLKNLVEQIFQLGAVCSNEGVHLFDAIIEGGLCLDTQLLCDLALGIVFSTELKHTSTVRDQLVQLAVRPGSVRWCSSALPSLGTSKRTSKMPVDTADLP